MSRELSGFPMGSTLAKIRQLAEARADVLADPPEDEATVQLRAEMERRAARLRAAGVLDPEAVAAILQAREACPRVAGHPGSEAAARAVEAFLAARDARTLLLLGPTGRGKSFASTWPLAGTSGAWLSASDVRVGGWDDLRPKAVAARLLVIDDLGREATEWAARELADVLELRHNRGLRTIATSNLLEDKLAARYGERCASRWNDSRFSRTVVVLGPDLRARGGR